jgi:PHP family Zn ribbon phosphoesterase
VAELCERVLAQVGPELAVLRDTPLEDVARAAGPLVAEAVSRVREGRVLVEPGYDGEFGTVRIFGAEERRGPSGRASNPRQTGKIASRRSPSGPRPPS